MDNNFSIHLTQKQKEQLGNNLILERFEHFDQHCLKTCLKHFKSPLDAEEEKCLDVCTSKIFKMLEYTARDKQKV